MGATTEKVEGCGIDSSLGAQIADPFLLVLAEKRIVLLLTWAAIGVLARVFIACLGLIQGLGF